MDKNKKIIITGASSGIGRELAIIFSEHGYKVLACSRNIEKLQKLKNEYPDLIDILSLDLTEKISIDQVAEKINSDFEISGLINNAGSVSFKPIIDHSDKEIESTLNTNLTGTILFTNKIIPQMIKGKSGTIANIISVVTEKTFPNSGIYTAAKAGLKGYAQVLREELRSSGIRVINVYPGATATPIWDSKIINKFGDKMLSPKKVAEVIFESLIKEDIVTEEIVLRPQTGDL